MNQGTTVDFPQLQWRPATASDVHDWAGLIARTAAAENPVWYEREADLQQQVESRKNPPAANTVLGLDGDGVMGYGPSGPAGASHLATLCRRRRRRRCAGAGNDGASTA